MYVLLNKTHVHDEIKQQKHVTNVCNKSFQTTVELYSTYE